METMVIELRLSDDQAAELRSLLGTALRDLSHEIAATDNADFRAGLRESRDLLAAIRLDLESTVVED
jgi:hypothetical protein